MITVHNYKLTLLSQYLAVFIIVIRRQSVSFYLFCFFLGDKLSPFSIDCKMLNSIKLIRFVTAFWHYSLKRLRFVTLSLWL